MNYVGKGACDRSLTLSCSPLNYCDFGVCFASSFDQLLNDIFQCFPSHENDYGVNGGRKFLPVDACFRFLFGSSWPVTIAIDELYLRWVTGMPA